MHDQKITNPLVFLIILRIVSVNIDLIKAAIWEQANHTHDRRLHHVDTGRL